MHALGRKEYGRLGVGEGGEDCLVPTQVPGLAAARCLEVAAGTAVSYAVTEDGDCLAWGMGTNGQLGTGEEVSITGSAWGLPALVLCSLLPSRLADSSHDKPAGVVASAVTLSGRRKCGSRLRRARSGQVPKC